MNSNLMKFIAGMIGLGVWVWMAVIKLTPVEPLIDLLKVALGGLVTHMLTTNEPPRRVSLRAPPAAAAQAGFASVRVLALLALGTGLLLALSGCASLTQAGNTAYVLKPAAEAPGQYEFSVNDGKEFASRKIKFKQTAAGEVSVDIDEGASSAFQGQAIAGKALSVLPSFAPQILQSGPATVVPQIEAESQAAAAGAVRPPAGVIGKPVGTAVGTSVCYLTAPPYCPK